MLPRLLISMICTSKLQYAENYLAYKGKKACGETLATNKKLMESKGATIVGDGWSDPQRTPLINFMLSLRVDQCF